MELSSLEESELLKPIEPQHLTQEEKQEVAVESGHQPWKSHAKIRPNPVSSTFFQPLSVHDWTSAFLLNVHRLCGAIEGKIEPHWLIEQIGRQ